MPPWTAAVVIKASTGGRQQEDTAGLLFNRPSQRRTTVSSKACVKETHVERMVDKVGGCCPCRPTQWILLCNLVCFVVHFAMVWVTVYFHHWSAKGEKDLKLKVFRIQINCEKQKCSNPMCGVV